MITSPPPVSDRSHSNGQFPFGSGLFIPVGITPYNLALPVNIGLVILGDFNGFANTEPLGRRGAAFLFH